MSVGKKILIAAIALLFLIVPIFLLFFQKDSVPTGGSKVVIIDNKSNYSSGVDDSVFIATSSAAYSAVSLNIPSDKLEDFYHGIIRSRTFEKDEYTVSFILDIPSLKMSWVVSQAIDSERKALSDAYIECIDEERAIYPITSPCIDADNDIEGTIDDGFPIGKDLPIKGPEYVIDYIHTEGTDNSYTIVITYYAESGKQQALDALISLGYDPSNYTIVYQPAA